VQLRRPFEGVGDREETRVVSRIVASLAVERESGLGGGEIHTDSVPISVKKQDTGAIAWLRSPDGKEVDLLGGALLR